MTCPLPPGHKGPCAKGCPVTTIDFGELVRCRLEEGHTGPHESAPYPVPGPYSESPPPDDLTAWRSLARVLRGRLTATQEAARSYLDARERVDPDGEREAKARLEEVLDDR
jgi:hypothetical protein